MSNSQDAGGIALKSLAEPARAELVGDGGVLIDRVATLDGATAGAIAFLANPRYRHQLQSTRASAVIIEPRFAAETALPKLVTSNPYAAYARVAALFHPPHPVAAGIHPTAMVAASARVAASATIGPCVVIGDRATIGERTWIHAGCAIGEDCSLGDDIVLYPRVVLYARTVVGARTLIHSGAVLGADGFGMADEDGKWLKVPQVGRVVVGADVEIGANTTIDRGTIDDTVIEDDVKLDNQIQIGHNCRIGAHTAIAGCVGVAGSVRIGRNCQIGGAAMITGHLDIADGTVVSAASGVASTPVPFLRCHIGSGNTSHR
jgi:UDP-3-O-[3-hydroxymyristoyl] glucosamine N-acyltransferase